MTAKQNRARGKRNEAAIAKLIPGAKRIGVLSGEDLEHPMFSIECKSRENMAVDKWFRQAEVNCPTDKTPLLILHVHNQKREKDIVCMRFGDWLDWYGEINGA